MEQYQATCHTPNKVELMEPTPYIQLSISVNLSINNVVSEVPEVDQNIEHIRCAMNALIGVISVYGTALDPFLCIWLPADANDEVIAENKIKLMKEYSSRLLIHHNKMLAAVESADHRMQVMNDRIKKFG